MNKLKKEQGITLVALVITTIVMLVLAVVTIASVTNKGVVEYAENATKVYDESQEKEEGVLEGYVDLLEGDVETGSWKVQKDGTIKNEKTGETKKIGDTFTNDEVLAATGGKKSSYTGTWTILGVKEGRLKLVSTKNIGGDEFLGYWDPNAPAGENIDKAIWSYQHVVETLDGYAKTKTGITSAISIRVEDLEAEDVFNIDNAKKLAGSENMYGTTKTYDYNSYPGKVFVDKEGKKVVLDSANDKITLEHTYYYYSSSKITAEQKTKYTCLLNSKYWLASPCVDCYTGGADFGVRYVYYDGIYSYDLFSSSGNATYNYCGVRAVVYI